MKIAFQINKINLLNSKTDSSLLMMNECLRRGLEVWFYYPQTLSWFDGEVYGECFKFLGSQDEGGLHAIKINLDEFNFVFIRQDPPFDMNYITSTYLLEMLKSAKVLNNPTSVRNCTEKLFVLNYSQYMPKTLITKNKNDVKNFLHKYKEIILKPIYAFGGKGVFHITNKSQNLDNAFDILVDHYGDLPIIAQQYIPNVKNGDKRIIFLNGEFLGAFDRIKAEGSVASNMIAGGSIRATKLTSIEHEICNNLGCKLKEIGLFLVGIDVIDDLITEINVTSPTGLAALNKLYNLKVEEKVISEMLKL